MSPNLGQEVKKPVRPEEESFMERALELAARGRGYTTPNPAVGAVIVQDGVVVGEGYHRRAGGPHAEVVALEAAGDRATNATMYVTLEPCVHYGRTPPCAEALVRAGLRRVVVAMADPNPLVSGRGLSSLSQAGLEVEVGWLQEKARELNEAFIKFILTGSPWVSLKAALSLDGKIATSSGASRWITGPAARQHGHWLRHWHDAILVGVGTVLQDDPQLTTRLAEGKDPVRVILDSRLRIPLASRVLHVKSSAPTVVATTAAAPAARRRQLEELGIEVWVVEEDAAGRVDLAAVLRRLAERQLTSVLVEGGSSVQASFLEAGLADKVYFFLAPKIIGGTRAPGPVGGVGVSQVADAWRLHDVRVEFLDRDLLVTGYVRSKK